MTVKYFDANETLRVRFENISLFRSKTDTNFERSAPSVTFMNGSLYQITSPFLSARTTGRGNAMSRS